MYEKLAEPVIIYPRALKNIRVKSKPEAKADMDDVIQVIVDNLIGADDSLDT